jgi:hypothetical protein
MWIEKTFAMKILEERIVLDDLPRKKGEGIFFIIV